MFQSSRSCLWDIKTTFTRRWTESLVISCPFRLPRSSFFADDKAVEHTLESSSAVEATGKSVCVIKEGVRSCG
jgi:hypothetical protein